MLLHLRNPLFPRSHFFKLIFIFDVMVIYINGIYRTRWEVQWIVRQPKTKLRICNTPVRCLPPVFKRRFLILGFDRLNCFGFVSELRKGWLKTLSTKLFWFLNEETANGPNVIGFITGGVSKPKRSEYQIQWELGKHSVTLLQNCYHIVQNCYHIAESYFVVSHTNVCLF